MSIKGITFAGQNVTPKNDGGLYGAHFGDGILWGCGMSISGDDLVVASGELIMCGRVVQIDGATNIDLSAHGLTTGYVRVIMNADLSQPEGSQWYATYDTSASTTFTALTTDDLNDTGTLYQIALAIVQVSGGALSIYSTISGSSLNTDGNVNINSAGGRRSVLITESGTPVGRFRYNAVTGYTEVGSTQNDGTLKAGIRGLTEAEVFADNDDIRFRPKGANDSTNEVYLDTSGQLHGGHLFPSDVTKSSQSITANTWASLGSLTLGVGSWLIMGTASFKCLGTSSDEWGMICVGHTNSATVCRQAVPLRGSMSAYLGANGSLLLENTTPNYTIDLYANASANTVVQNAILRAVQLG